MIETVSLPESSAIVKARRTVPTENVDRESVHLCWQSRHLVPLSSLNCCNTQQQPADNPLKMSHNIKQPIQLRLSKIYLYPIIIQVRTPFDNTASSCPGSLPLCIIYFHVVLEQLVIVVVQTSGIASSHESIS